MIYTAEDLVAKINDIPFDEEIKVLEDLSIDFDDATVEMRGFVFGDFDYEKGDYWTPPSSKLVYQVADIYEVIINYKENSEFLNGEEITHIEKLLKNIYY